MGGDNWPLIQSYILAIDAAGDAVEDRLKLCERGLAVGNTAALAVALNICARRNAPLPDWLNEALKRVIAEQIEPTQKRDGGRHARNLRRVNDMLTHLRRMQLVLVAYRREGISLEKAWERVADLLEDELIESGDPARVIKRSYNRGVQIVNDPKQREFIAAIYGSDVLLQLWALLTPRMGAKRRPRKIGRKPR